MVVFRGRTQGAGLFLPNCEELWLYYSLDMDPVKPGL